MQETKRLNNEIKRYEYLIDAIEDLEVLIELIIEEESYEEYREVDRSLNKIAKEAEAFKLSTLLSGEFDKTMQFYLSILGGQVDWKPKIGQKCF